MANSHPRGIQEGGSHQTLGTKLDSHGLWEVEVEVTALSCYGTASIFNYGGRAYVTRVPGHGGAEATPGTARESLATTEEPYLDFGKAWQRRTVDETRQEGCRRERHVAAPRTSGTTKGPNHILKINIII